MNRAGVTFGWRSAAVAASAATLFILLLWQGIRTGPATPTVGWVDASEGALLSQAILRMIGLVPWPWRIDVVSAVAATILMGLLVAWLYERLIYNDWSPVKALLFASLIATNPIVMETAAFDYRSLSTMLACVAIIPGIRRIESVGDVQANMSFGLVLPLLLLDGPPLAPLIVPLALFGALSDPIARTDIRAFVAMFLVALMPTLLVLAGLFGVLGSPGFFRLAALYLQAYVPQPLGIEASRHLLQIVAWTVLPFAIVTFFYMLQRDRRWQPVSAVVTLALPFYLVVGNLVFSWDIPATLPTVAFLAAFASWLSVARLKPAFRFTAVTLMALTSIVGWYLPVLPPAAMSVIDTVLSLRPGL